MVIELINTGTELLLGRIANTHQQWLGRRLSELGYTITRQVTVPDTAQAIEQAVRDALCRADLVITTGGLGPTSDDLTRERIAHLLGKPLREDARILARLEQFFAARNRPMPTRNRVQALVPEGARVLENPWGTAPGLALEVRPNPFRPGGAATWLVMLPGPTRELRPMFDEAVVPLLREQFPLKQTFVSRTLRTIGVGESSLQEKIAAPLESLVAAGLEIAYCADAGCVDVRLSAVGHEATRLVQEAERIVREILGDNIYGQGEEEIEAVVVRLLTERKQTLALAESCTGGAIANRLTNVPGASVVFLAGLVTYSNEAKKKFLGVRAETLGQHGAVSEAVAREMAEGARRQAGADYALAVTGIAGPGGGTPEKPVGTVFIALATGQGTLVTRQFFPTDRLTFKQLAANHAFDLLRRHVLKSHGS